MTNANEYLNRSISSGTHDLRDLIPTFIGLWRELAPTEAARFERGTIGPVILDIIGNYDWPHTEDAREVYGQLFEELDALAPAGYYFGAHEGDGSDFGFWECETDDSEE